MNMFPKRVTPDSDDDLTLAVERMLDTLKRLDGLIDTIGYRVDAIERTPKQSNNERHAAR